MVRRSPGLLAACDDPRLIGLRLWPVQRRLLRDVEGQRLHVWRLGRRSGKSTAAAAALVWDAALRPHLDRMVLSGTARHSVCIATAGRQARLVLSAAVAILERSELLSALIVSVSEDSIVLRSGNVVSAFPVGSRSARGWPISCVVFDEMAHHVDSDGNAAAEQMWQALTPSVLQFGKESRIICASTPSGSGGFFADLYRRVESGEIDGAAHHASTAESNPTVDPEFLHAERQALGEEAFRQEYGGEFLSGGGSFFDADEVRSVIGKPCLPEDGRGWVCAIDPSSGGGDPFAAVVVGRDSRPGFEGRLIVGHVERWLPRKGTRLSRRSRTERDLWIDSTLDRVAAVAARFGASVISDQHLPGVVSDELRKRGVTRVKIVPWTATTRSEAFQALRARVATERISILDDEQLVAELLRVRTRFRAGASVVEIGRVGDSHGDLAVALAAGVKALDSRSPDSPLHTASATRLSRARRELSAADAEQILGFSPITRREHRRQSWLENRKGWGR